MDYDVKFVEYKGGNIKVSYTVTPLNSHEEASIISRIDCWSFHWPTKTAKSLALWLPR